MRRVGERLPVPSGLSMAFVLVFFAIGAAYGHRTGMADCSTGAVQYGAVLLGNLGMALLLMSGWFCLGLSTVVLGAVTIGGTGAAAGAIVQHYGPVGVVLLAPHGVVELWAAGLSTEVGLSPLYARLRPTHRVDGGVLRGRALFAVGLIAVAALIEVAWTSTYGAGVDC